MQKYLSKNICLSLTLLLCLPLFGKQADSTVHTDVTHEQKTSVSLAPFSKKFAAFLEEMHWVLSVQKNIPHAAELKNLLTTIEQELAQLVPHASEFELALSYHRAVKLLELQLTQQPLSSTTAKLLLEPAATTSLEGIIQETEIALKRFQTTLATAHLSKFQKVSRTLYNFSTKTLPLDEIASRAMPYAAFAGFLYLYNKHVADLISKTTNDKNETVTTTITKPLAKLLSSLNIPADKHAGVLNFTKKSLEFAPGILLWNNFKQDMKDLKTATKFWYEDNVRPAVLGTPHRDYLPYAKTTTRIKDFPNNPELHELLPLFAYHFVHQDDTKNLKHPLEKGFMFVGDSLYEARHYAYALAGEVTHLLKQEAYPEDFHVYEMHGSTLTTKKLADKLAEVEAKGVPAMILINELDWLFSKKVKAEVIGQFVGAIGKMAEASSHKRVIIAATARSTEHLDPALFYPRRFAYTFHIKGLSAEQRANVVRKYFTKQDLKASEELIATVAAHTEGYSAQLLDDLVRHAYSLAHFKAEPLSEKHFEYFYMSDLYASA